MLFRSLVVPAGRTINDLTFEWVHRGMPWWDPAKEISGNVAAIQAGLDNPYRICKETGRGEFEDNVDAIARAQEYAASRGVSLSYAMQATAPEPVDTEDSSADTTEDSAEYDAPASRNTRGRA